MKNAKLFLIGAIFLSFVLALIITPVFSASSFPEKTIKLIVPFSPGGGFDTYSRAISRVMPKYLPNKVHVVVKNVPGAGSRTGTIMLYRSKPDGYTIGILNTMGLIALNVVNEQEQYDIKKFTYLGIIARDFGGIYVSAKSSFYTLKDLQNAKRVRFGTHGVGSGSWALAQLSKAMGIPVQLVTGYPGSVQYILACIKGDTDAVNTGGFTEPPYVKSGDLRPIIMFSLEPNPYLPDAPTLKGTPYEDFASITTDRPIAAPPGLSKETANILETALLKSLKDAGLQKWSEKVDRPLDSRSGKETYQIIVKQIQLLEKYKDLLTK